MQASRYGMKLNRDKCVKVGMNTEASVRYGDGTKVKDEKEVVYKAR